MTRFVTYSAVCFLERKKHCIPVIKNAVLMGRIFRGRWSTQIDVIYTDFDKAFDKVPQNRLLQKLQSYQINSDVIELIHDLF